ncbi:MAG: hypothetical protein IIY54_08100, partial [Ruminococcus sp.]|nr:hypothetical protein [Ruminococcus sp.]
MSMTGCHKSWGKYIVTGGGISLCEMTGDLHGRQLTLRSAVFDIVLRLDSVRKKRTLWEESVQNP